MYGGADFESPSSMSPCASGRRDGTSGPTVAFARCDAHSSAGASRSVSASVEAPDERALGRAMKGLEVRMARALNKVMKRSGPVFADRYHARLLRSPRGAWHALRYVLENRAVHAVRLGLPAPVHIDPCCSEAWRDHSPPLTAAPRWWLLCVGVPMKAGKFAATTASVPSSRLA